MSQLTWFVKLTKIASRNTKHSQLYVLAMSSGDNEINLYAMWAKKGTVTAKLSPLVSIKSCLVMEVGSMWCSRKGRIKAYKNTATN